MCLEICGDPSTFQQQTKASCIMSPSSTLEAAEGLNVTECDEIGSVEERSREDRIHEMTFFLKVVFAVLLTTFVLFKIV